MNKPGVVDLDKVKRKGYVWAQMAKRNLGMTDKWMKIREKEGKDSDICQ
jgi:hypothetical protein